MSPEHDTKTENRLFCRNAEFTEILRLSSSPSYEEHHEQKEVLSCEKADVSSGSTILFLMEPSGSPSLHKRAEIPALEISLRLLTFTGFLFR